MNMEVTANRKQTTFRLSIDLLERLKQAARKRDISLNNYVESLLIDVMYNEPNEGTKTAINEACAGKSAGELNLTDFDAFMEAVNDIK